MMDWYVIIKERQYGPYTLGQLIRYIEEGRILSDSFIWKEGFPEWQKAGEVDELKPYFPMKVKDAAVKFRGEKHSAYRFLLAVCLLASLVFLSFRTYTFIQLHDRTIDDPVTVLVSSEGLYTEGTVKLGAVEIPFTRVFGDDTSGDGYPDRRSYYRDDVLVLAAWDTNRDGNHDLWFRFADGYYVDLEAYDLTGDGKVDKLLSIDENEMVAGTELLTEVEIDLIGMAKALGPFLLLPFIFIFLMALHKHKRRRISTLCLILAVSLVFPPLPVLRAQDLCNEDGSLNEAVFEQEWRKYSTFDELIPPESRSWEVQQYHGTQERINQLDYEAFELGIQMEYDRQIRLELREVKSSLVQNLRANLVKSFFRLSFLTADAIKTGYGLGKNYAKLFSIEAIKATANLPDAISYLKDALEVVTSLAPDGSGDGSELVKEIKHYEALRDDAIKIMENPASVAGIAAKRVIKTAEEKLGKLFPSVSDMKFSEEEVEILRSQNLRNRLIDDILMESYRENSERRSRIEAIHMQISDLVGEQQQWVQEEKERVRFLLEEACRRDKDRDAEHEDEEDANEGNEEIQPPVGDVAAGGLSGIWLGTGTYVEIFDTTGWDEDMQKAHLGTTRPMGIGIGSDDRGSYFIYDRETQVVLLDVPAGPTFPLYVEGRKLSFTYEGKDPTGEVDIYWVFNGEVNENYTVITGTSEIGSNIIGGPMFILRTTVMRQ